MRTFKQLTERDRVMISRLRNCGISLAAIARKIGKDKSTVSRELRRNGTLSSVNDQLFWLSVQNLWDKEEIRAFLNSDAAARLSEQSYWTANEAQRIRDTRMNCANKVRCRKNLKTINWVTEKLREQWSPEQIAGRSGIDGPEKVSHEYVYSLVLADRKRGGRLYKCLRRYRKRKQRFNNREYGIGIPNRIGIEARPEIVDARVRLGDLEGDLIQGYKSSGYVLSVLDRKSRRVVLRKLSTKHKKRVKDQLAVAIKHLGQSHTLTLDNGREFCDHDKVTKATGVRVYFAQPYCATQRGAIENMNGLVRYYLPKKTSFAKLTQTELNIIQEKLNSRPRKCLGFLTPKEIHTTNKITSCARSLHL